MLFDRAINDIEHSRYEIARLTLQTLINTYDTSEFLAKAKLAIADSWFREGGAHGLAQAEAEYKDFELFYPTWKKRRKHRKASAISITSRWIRPTATRFMRFARRTSAASC